MNSVEIFLRKRNKFIVCSDNSEQTAELMDVFTFVKNLESLGYCLSQEFVQILLNSSLQKLVDVYDEIIPLLREIRGTTKRWQPMYPKFPSQVMTMSDTNLYINAMLHYWGSAVTDITNNPSFVVFPKNEEVSKKEEMSEIVKSLSKLTQIDVGTEEEFRQIFTQLVGSNSSLSESDKNIVKWFTEQNYNVQELLPAQIPQKETIAMLAGWLKMPDYITKYLKTATDVLRVAVILSAGDVSLAKPTKFKKFNRPTRRFLLSSMENCFALTEDMLRRKEVFLRLGEILHPGSYQTKYPKTFAAFQVIRNGEKFETFGSKVEKSILACDYKTFCELLSKRPGEFARRLDHLLRFAFETKELNYIVSSFMQVGDKVATPLLVQIYNHFRYRNASATRAFFPKGSIAKCKLSEDVLPEIDVDVKNELTNFIRSTLVQRFSNLPALGNVYLNSNLVDQNVPFTMRSASKALKTVARGSRFDCGEGSTIRMFLWWKQPANERVDIDLSAVVLDENFKHSLSITYYSLRHRGKNGSVLGCHSGDITSAPNGACEFIDLNIDVAAESGRYVCMVLNSYTHQPYCNLPECFAGWMMRSEPNSGEVFEARTVQNRVDLAADSRIAIPVIFDLKTRKMIWVDLSLKNISWCNNVNSNAGGINKMVRAMVGLNKPKLYDLFEMHTEARGKIVGDPAEADTVFSLDKGITPYDIDKILSEFLA